MKTLTLNTYENYLLWFAAVHAPLDGLRLSDLPKLEAAKKLFQCERFDGDRTVEVPTDIMPYVKATWEALPIGKLTRTDDLPATVAAVSAKLKE